MQNVGYTIYYYITMVLVHVKKTLEDACDCGIPHLFWTMILTYPRKHDCNSSIEIDWLADLLIGKIIYFS